VSWECCRGPSLTRSGDGCSYLQPGLQPGPGELPRQSALAETLQDTGRKSLLKPGLLPALSWPQRCGPSGGGRTHLSIPSRPIHLRPQKSPERVTHPKRLVPGTGTWPWVLLPGAGQDRAPQWAALWDGARSPRSQMCTMAGWASCGRGAAQPQGGFRFNRRGWGTSINSQLAFICVLVTRSPHLPPSAGTHGWIMAGARQPRALNSGVITRL